MKIFVLTMISALMISGSASANHSSGNVDVVRVCLETVEYVKYMGSLPRLKTDKQDKKTNLDYGLNTRSSQFELFKIVAGPNAIKHVDDIRLVLKDAVQCALEIGHCKEDEIVAKALRLSTELETACASDYRIDS